MATVSEIKNKLPIVLKSKTSTLLVRIDGISLYNEGVGTVVGSGNNKDMTAHRVGDHCTTWSLGNFNIFEG